MAKIVTCDWPESSPTTYLDHYEVWRKTGSGGTYAKISGDIAQGTLTYVDSSTLADATEYFYEVRAYNATGDYNEVENSITISGASTPLVLEQPFAGQLDPIITDADWTVLVTNPTQYNFAKDDGLVVSGVFGTTASLENSILSKTSILSDDCCLSFDLAMDDEAAASGFIGIFSNLSAPVIDAMGLRLQADGIIDGYVKLDDDLIITTGDLVYDSPVGTPASCSVQIVGDGTNCTIYLWEGSWVEKQSIGFTKSTQLYFGMFGTSGAANKPTGKFKNVALGTFANRWTTQYPSGMTPY